jgi:hypothetical protein
MKPFSSRNRITWRDRTAGNLVMANQTRSKEPRKPISSARVLQIQRGDQGIVVGGNCVTVFAQAGDIAGDGVLGHFSSFFQCAAISHASRERRHERSVATLRFGPEHDVVAVAGSGHRLIVVLCARVRQKCKGDRSDRHLVQRHDELNAFHLLSLQPMIVGDEEVNSGLARAS